ncbi:MAG: alpha/beta hydrolase [Isosphaeraceae bacterium]
MRDVLHPTPPGLFPPSLPDAAERWIDVGGYRTRYYRFGEGPPLVLIPTIFLPAASYRGTIAGLARQFDVIAAEMPGSGRSQRVERPWGFREGADWAAGLLDALGLDRAIVVGHSDAGGVAAVLGARHPGRLDALVLADSVGAFPGATWYTLLLRRCLDAALEEVRLNLPLGPQVFLNLLRHPRNWLYHAFRLTADTTPLELAPGIDVPTLLAWGRRDHTFPPACAERFRDAIPNSQISWSDASHDWLITHPVEFSAAVATWARNLGLLTKPLSEDRDSTSLVLGRR